MIQLSEKLKEFLKWNNIYDIETIFQFSMRFISSMPGFDADIEIEIKNLFNSRQCKKNDLSSYPQFMSKLLTKEELGYPKQKSVYKRHKMLEYNGEQIAMSNRLYHIVKVNGFVNNIKKFLLISDDELIKLKNFGEITLSEVQNLREKILTKNEFIDLKPKNFNSCLNKIYIPHVLKHLPLGIVNKFQKNLPFLNKATKSFESHFHTLGDFHGHNHDSLMAIRGLGKNKVNPIIDWFNSVHQGKYQELIKQFEDQGDAYFDNIHHSYIVGNLLKDYNIHYLSGLIVFDNISPNEFTIDQKIGLLELRTLFYDEDRKKLSTRTNHTTKKFNLVQDLDTFVTKFLAEKEREFSLERWNNKAIRELVKIGQSHLITRERVRQILEKVRNNFTDLFIEDITNCKVLLVDIIKKSARPIILEELGYTQEEEIKYTKLFYINFFRELFSPIPIYKPAYKSMQNDLLKLKRSIYKKAELPFQLKFNDIIINRSYYELANCLNVIFNPDSGLEIVTDNNEKYVNKKYYSSFTLAKHIIYKSDKVLHIDEIIKAIEKLGGKKPNLLGLIGRLDSEEGIYKLKWREFGTSKHFSYPHEKWSDIQKECVAVLQDQGHQMGIGFIYNAIKNKFPKLYSKYELVYILRDCKDFIDLGFFNFSLKRFGQRHRILVRELAVEILKRYSKPIHADILFKEITNERTFNREAITALHRQIREIDLYRPAYYGLKSKRDNNIFYLSTHIPYIENFINWFSSFDNRLTIKRIVQKINYIDTEQNFIQMVTKSSKYLKIKQINEGTFENYIVSKKMAPIKLAIITLAVYNRPMLYNEIEVILKNYFKYIDNSGLRLSGLRNRLNNEPKIIKNGNYFSYNNQVTYLCKFSNIFKKAVEIIEIWGEYIKLDELYILLEDIENLPRNDKKLLSLLKLDGRFEILSNSLIGLKEF